MWPTPYFEGALIRIDIDALAWAKRDGPIQSTPARDDDPASFHENRRSGVGHVDGVDGAPHRGKRVRRKDLEAFSADPCARWQCDEGGATPKLRAFQTPVAVPVYWAQRGIPLSFEQKPVRAAQYP